MLIDLISHVIFAAQVNIDQEVFADQPRLIAERFFQCPVQILPENDVGGRAKKKQQPCQQARIPYSQPEADRARVHVCPSSPIA
jgi:hypothetical protein